MLTHVSSWFGALFKPAKDESQDIAKWQKKMSHLAHLTRCQCPPWWQPQNREPSDWYRNNVLWFPNLGIHIPIKFAKYHDKCAYKWERMTHCYVNDGWVSEFPIAVATSNYADRFLICLAPNSLNTDFNGRCGLGHGCCVICKSTEYSAADRERMRESRAELHAELLAYVWHPSRMARMVA